MKEVLLVLPAYNEEDILKRNAESILNHKLKGFSLKICIVTNGCTDSSSRIAEELRKSYPGRVSHIDLPEKGRGGAIREAWVKSKADLLSYMDADLSTSLYDLNALFDAICKGNDIAIGSRYLPNSKVKREFFRLVISRVYNMIIRLIFRANITDFQCGFKAIKNDAARVILQEVKSDGWFFDTELLVKGKRKGLKIKEIPVRWNENAKSKVNLLKDTLIYIGDIFRLFFEK